MQMHRLFALALFAACVTGPAVAQTPAAAPTEVPSNAELKAMFGADQAARMDANADWDKISKDDIARRKRVREMLDAGELRTGADFVHAAFIFQHSLQSDDYLLAHALAMAGAQKGHRMAPWIAAATLDRYLHSIGKAQVYGTQKHPGPNDELTPEPYNRTLITDALRRSAGVPELADQR